MITLKLSAPVRVYFIRVLFSGAGGGGSAGAIVVAPVLTVERK